MRDRVSRAQESSALFVWSRTLRTQSRSSSLRNTTFNDTSIRYITILSRYYGCSAAEIEISQRTLNSQLDTTHRTLTARSGQRPHARNTSHAQHTVQLCTTPVITNEDYSKHTSDEALDPTALPEHNPQRRAPSRARRYAASDAHEPRHIASSREVSRRSVLLGRYWQGTVHSTPSTPSTHSVARIGWDRVKLKA